MSKTNYDIIKELDAIKNKMYGTNFEQDGIILSDAIDLIKDAKHCVDKMKERYQDGMNAVYAGDDESDEILCPVCKCSLACNDDFIEVRPNHCPDCGTKIIY